MSERGEDVPHEVSVDEQDSDFQRQILEFIKDTRTQFQMVDEQIKKLFEEVKTAKENAKDIMTKPCKERR